MFVNYLQMCTLSASGKLQKVVREGSEQVWRSFRSHSKLSLSHKPPWLECLEDRAHAVSVSFPQLLWYLHSHSIDLLTTSTHLNHSLRSLTKYKARNIRLSRIPKRPHWPPFCQSKSTLKASVVVCPVHQQSARQCSPCKNPHLPTIPYWLPYSQCDNWARHQDRITTSNLHS